MQEPRQQYIKNLYHKQEILINFPLRELEHYLYPSMPKLQKVDSD